MKIIIIGCGKIGQSLAAGLSAEENDVTCIDTSESLVAAITDMYDVMGICGNGADSNVLTEAGAEKADLLVAVTGSDELNMLACFIGGRMGARNTIARIRNPEYNDASLDILKKELELSEAINPEKLTAHEIYNILKFPSAVNVERFSKGLEMIELRLSENSPLDGLSLHELRSRFSAKILVCCVRRSGEVYIPDGSFELKSNDVIGITGNGNEIHRFLKDVGLLRKKAKSVMLLGGSRTAYYLAQMILAGGSSVTVIDKDRRVCEAFASEIPDASVICADGTNHEILLEEGIRSCDAFVSLTGIDEENILVSIFASSQNVPKVVTKINSDSLVKMAATLGIDSPVCPHNAVSNVVLRYARALKNSEGSKVETLYRLFDGQAEALEFTIDGESEITGKPLKDLKLKKNVLLAGIVRDRKTIIPGGSDHICRGDRVIAIAEGQKISDISDLLGEDR